MTVLLVRNTLPGPLVLVDERDGNKQEFQWEPGGDSAGGDVLEVPDSLAASIHFRRVVQKGMLVIERRITDDLALMGPSDSSWIENQTAPSLGTSAPTTVIGETSDGVSVIMDKTATAPISTMVLDENGEIVRVEAPTIDERQVQRGRVPQQQPPSQPEPQADSATLEAIMQAQAQQQGFQDSGQGDGDIADAVLVPPPGLDPNTP